MPPEAEQNGLEEPSRGLPVFLVAVALTVALGLGFLAYRIWFAGGGGDEMELVTEPVQRTTIRATIITSGVAKSSEQVELQFTQSGRVEETLVELGQEVKKGDPLIRLEDETQRNRLDSAQANLASAQIRVGVLLKGASLADVAGAEQSVVSAQASLNGAQRDLDELSKGPTAAELAAAEQAVAAAQASLASAQVSYDQVVEGPSTADSSAAESSVSSAEQALTTAQNSLQNALANVASAEGGLRTAGAAYCAEFADDPVCAPFVVPLDEVAVSYLLSLITFLAQGQDASLLNEINALVQANNAYLAANNAVETALASVASTQTALAAAEARLDDLQEGAADQELEAARASLASAQANLESAQLTFDDLRAGADATQLATAADAVRSAQSSLAAALALRNDVLDGADPEDVALQMQQVRLAQLSVEAARKDLDEATLGAPFDGTVGAINVRPGDLVGPATNALTLLTPNALKIELSVGETELASIRTGMAGVILFDAVQGRQFPISVYAISLAPRVEQGVVTYTVEAALQGLEGEGPKPAPGMNGSAILVSEQRTDVLAVPSRAIRRLGEELVVDVLVDGVAEARAIKTGLTDGEMTEVTGGLEEGELVVVGTRRSGESGEQSEEPEEEELPEGIQ